MQSIARASHSRGLQHRALTSAAGPHQDGRRSLQADARACLRNITSRECAIHRSAAVAAEILATCIASRRVCYVAIFVSWPFVNVQGRAADGKEGGGGHRCAGAVHSQSAKSDLWCDPSPDADVAEGEPKSPPGCGSGVQLAYARQSRYGCGLAEDDGRHRWAAARAGD